MLRITNTHSLNDLRGTIQLISAPFFLSPIEVGIVADSEFNFDGNSSCERPI